MWLLPQTPHELYISCEFIAADVHGRFTDFLILRYILSLFSPFTKHRPCQVRVVRGKKTRAVSHRKESSVAKKTRTVHGKNSHEPSVAGLLFVSLIVNVIRNHRRRSHPQPPGRGLQDSPRKSCDNFPR